MSEAAELAIILTAKDAASKVVEGLGQRFNALGAAGKLAAAGVAAAGAAAASLIGGLTHLANESAKSAGEVARLKRETGLTAIEASKLRVIGQRLGLDTDELSTSFGKLSKHLVDNRDRLGELGITVATNSRGNVDFEQTLGNVADRFARMPDGVEKSALSMELFGKTGKDLIPLLNKGRDGLKELGDEAARMGLVFDDKALAAAKRYRDAQKDLGENVEGLKNRISMAFLPILADVSTAMVGIADKVLPPISAGFDRLSGFVRTATGVVKDMVAAFNHQQVGGGDFLASLIGPKAAGDFMDLVDRIGETWHKAWNEKIQPALVWAQTNVPKIWDAIKNAIEAAWNAARPKLEAFVDKLQELKTRFDALPEPVKKWAEATAAGVVIVKATGLDDIIQGWANAIGNFVGGVSGGVAALVALGVSVAAAAALLAILATAIGVVIFVGSHLDDLEQAWVALVGTFRLLFAQLADSLILLFDILVGSIELKINHLIDTVNFVWTLLGNPPIPHIHIDLPNADNVRRTLDDLARDRVAHLTVIEEISRHAASEHAEAFAPPGAVLYGGPQASGGDYLVSRPTVFLAGEAGPERATFTPIRGGGSSGADAGAIIHNHIHVEIDGREVARATQVHDRSEQRRFGVVLDPSGA